MTFNAVVRWRDRRFGFHPPRPMLRPTVGSGLIISWSGMRGIVSLAAAMAIPSGFPYRDLIVLTAFSVVLGTLVIQGLTLKPLLRALNLHDDDPVGREVRVARERALHAGLASFADDQSPVADAVRQEFAAHLTHTRAGRRRHRCHASRTYSAPSASPGGGAASCCRHACRATKLATMRSTESKRSWIGSKWQGGRQAEKADAKRIEVRRWKRERAPPLVRTVQPSWAHE